MSQNQHPRLPEHLSQREAQGLFPGQPVAQFMIGDMRNFVYLILDWDSKKASIVDPQRDLTEIDSALAAGPFTLDSILLTHTHHDHIAGLPELIRRHPKLPIHVHDFDAKRLSDEFRPNLRPVLDGDVLKVGTLEIEALHTPGHSAGECSYLLRGKPAYLFTGDTIFIRDCGRTDLSTGSNEEMFISIQRVKKMDPATIILPGHHYKPECASTIGREIESSPPFQVKSAAELAVLP